MYSELAIWLFRKTITEKGSHALEQNRSTEIEKQKAEILQQLIKIKNDLKKFDEEEVEDIFFHAGNLQFGRRDFFVDKIRNNIGTDDETNDSLNSLIADIECNKIKKFLEAIKKINREISDEKKGCVEEKPPEKEQLNPNPTSANPPQPYLQEIPVQC